MKIEKRITLNVHSTGGEADLYKQEVLAELILRERPLAVALQEVCQTRSAPLASAKEGLISVSEHILLREDHFLIGLLSRLSGEYKGVWLPVKLGYGVRDEGVALLTRFEPREIRRIPLSPYRPYEDWRRREALAVSDPSGGEWTVSLHTSWWEEGFLLEWNRLNAALPKDASVWLMGDFNVTAERMAREGDPLVRAGFFDAYTLAEEGDAEDTVLADADGWRERSASDGLRIDRILCRPPKRILRYRRILDGRQSPVISDHFGVMTESEEHE